jgi:hypothetical protein
VAVNSGVCVSFPHSALEHRSCLVVAHDEDDAVERAAGMGDEVLGDRADHLAGALGQAQSADAGAERREGDRPHANLIGDAQDWRYIARPSITVG